MKYLLLILCAIELLFITYWQNIAGPYLSPLLFLIASLGIGFTYLKLTTTPATAIPVNSQINPKAIFAAQLVIYGILSYLVIKTLKTIWWWDMTQDSGIDKSDIIQQITVLVTRFLGHQQPYAIIHFKEYDLYPTYMPFQWMPYILTELAHKDYRWVPAIALWLSGTYFFIKNCSPLKLNMPPLAAILIPVWPLIVWYTAIMHFNPMFKLTVEGLIAAYYLFVATSISNKKGVWLGIGIALCLLSRYSIILWVPLCLLAYAIAGQRKKALITSSIILLFIFILYWFPFMRKDPAIFLNGYHYHSTAALLEWQRDIQMLHSKFYLMNGLGFTSWALKLLPGDLKHIISAYQAIHLSLCLLTVTSLLVYYWRRKATVSLNVFLLFSFKVYLAVFYAFIQIPYKYLYLVPVIISSALLADSWSNKRAKAII